MVDDHLPNNVLNALTRCRKQFQRRVLAFEAGPQDSPPEDALSETQQQQQDWTEVIQGTAGSEGEQPPSQGQGEGETVVEMHEASETSQTGHDGGGGLDVQVSIEVVENDSADEKLSEMTSFV